MPDAKLLHHDQILSFEEIVEVVETAARMGITKVRITGGEPLVRRDIAKLVEALARITPVRDLAMTTNGTLLSEHASALRAAGLHRVNISLDSLDPERFAAATGGGELSMVLAGIEAARRVGLVPIKLNCVVGATGDVSDPVTVKAFAEQGGMGFRAIHRMHFQTGSFSRVEGGSGGDCARCNRLRLSSEGGVRPCLFSDVSFGVRQLGAEEAIRRAVECKPQAGTACAHDWMVGIGG